MKRSLGNRLLLTLGPWLAALIIRALGWTVRYQVLGLEHPRQLWSEGRFVILSFWHDQLLMMANAYRGPKAKILISASKDGELIAKTMAYFGQEAVRGSSHRGGRAAFRELVALAREPVDLVITPDGPRGPRHQIKEGVVQLARITGRGVVPYTFQCSRGYRFASWDRFLFPYPFARGVFVYGPPLFFAEGEDAEAFRLRLDAAMQENERKGAAHLEAYGLSPV
jgi:hypothetical protein